MKNKKLIVTVGIPAYNEEKNIANIINEILLQEGKHWYLKEIIVCNDCSKDKTFEKVKNINSNKIRVVNNKKRSGKTFSIKVIIKKSKGEVIILFDADLKLVGKRVIENLAKEFISDKNVMLVGGNKSPFPPENFVEKGIYSTFEVFYESKLKLNNGSNIFGCQGGCLGIRKKFAKQINLPNVISDDAYLYLACISRGYKFKYVDNAVVYYKNAGTLSDYLKQLFRAKPGAVDIFLKKYFGDLVKKEFHRPVSFYLTSIMKSFIRRPFPTAFIIGVNLFSIPLVSLIAKKYKRYYATAESTKSFGVLYGRRI